MGDAHVDRAVPPGIGTRSWYYPKVAKTNCAECHMPLMESNDFDAEGERIARQSGGERENPDAHGRRLESPAC